MQPGDIVGHRFRLDAPVGRGAMGRLFRATDLSDGATAALKIVLAESRQQTRRFLREARILAGLTHPAIVAYRAHGMTSDGNLFLGMEWVDGPDLARQLRQRALTSRESLTLVARVAEALAAVHRAGVVHRDVKPANIVIPEGQLARAKLVDFGVAHLSPTLHGATAFTRTGALVGTPGFLAPEQVRGARVDGRADIFALGCVLFECLSGRPAFQASNLLAMLARIALEPAPTLSQVCPGSDPETTTLVGQMLEKDPEDRPRDAREVVDRLRRLAEAAPTRRTVGPQPERRVSALEQRLASIVAAKVDTDAQGLATELEPGGPLRQLAGDLAAELAILPGGFIVLRVDSEEDTPIEAALRAARLALAIKRAHERARVVVVSAHSDADAAAPVGPALDRVAAALERGGQDAVVVDHETAGLLRARYVVETRDGQTRLLGERAAGRGAPLLLGRRTPFVGRGREMALLEATFEEAAAEPASRAVVVLGDAGLGKSRIACELADGLAAHHGAEAVLLHARADPMSTGTAYATLSPALRQAFDLTEHDSPAESSQKIRSRLRTDRLGPGDLPVALLLGELAGLPSDREEIPQLGSARLDAQLFAEQLREAFVAWLREACSDGPRLIVVDDLHWADVATIRLIDHALASLEACPLMVVGLGRPQTSERFPTLWDGRHVTALRLGRLPNKAAERLVQVALGDQVTAQQTQRIARRADGNPFFLEELVRANTNGIAGTLPDSVLGMVETRLTGLEVEARQVLRAASVFGETFWSGGVLHLLAAQSIARDVNDWLATLVSREVVTRQAQSRFVGEGQFVFRHGLVREACYATLRHDDRRSAHALAASWLEASGEDGAATVAVHFEIGGEKERSIRWFCRAAAAALRADDLQGAIEHADRGVKNGASGAALGELRLLQAEAWTWSGEAEKARQGAEQAVALLVVGSPAWCAAVATLAEGSALLGSWEGMDCHEVLLCEQASELLAAVSDGAEADGSEKQKVQAHAAALARVSFCLVLVGRVTQSEQAATLADQLGERIGQLDPLVAGHLAHARATQALMARRHERAMSLFRAAATVFDAAGARRLASGARANVGAMCIELGAYEQAAHELDEALRLAQKARTAYGAALARLNLGIALVGKGQLEEGMACEREAISALRTQGDVRLEASARCALAEALLAQQDVAGAERQATQAVQLSHALAPARIPALAVLAQVRLRAGRPAEALEATREGLALLQAQSAQEGEIRLRLAHAEASLAMGAEAAARSVLGEAYGSLLAEVETTISPELRRSMIDRVPVHARVVALYEQLARGELLTPSSPE